MHFAFISYWQNFPIKEDKFEVILINLQTQRSDLASTLNDPISSEPFSALGSPVYGSMEGNLKAVISLHGSLWEILIPTRAPIRGAPSGPQVCQELREERH